MSFDDHEAAVSVLGRYFCAYTLTYTPSISPILVLGSPFHYSPAEDGTLIAPDLAALACHLATLWRQGVQRQKLKFGTVNKDGSPIGVTGCNGLNSHIITIPVSDIFYDPPVPAIGYTPLPPPPPALMTAVFRIDLCDVQQMVLMYQQK
ncbi:5546_t:CDS:2 [Diversispora eburnea]|uniref:5546_t:CDS:1 n=1 Tax=Diversispora eburnea TaxID=1213867 RepID=A0A9N8V2Y3_9GLOM|nr:5546_t:CDS:2 [Diversispora eburnea]